MPKWHPFVFAAAFLIPFKFGLFHKPPAAQSLGSPLVDGGIKVPFSSSLEKVTAETPSPSAPKRPKLFLLAFPHHEISSTFFHAGELHLGAQVATDVSFKGASEECSSEKQSYGAEVGEFKSIDLRILQVMARDQTQSSVQGTVSGKKTCTESTSLYYRVIRGMANNEYEPTLDVDPLNQQDEYSVELTPLYLNKRISAAELARLKNKALSSMQLHKHPELRTLKNYLTFLVYQRKSTHHKSQAILHHLALWNIPSRQPSAGGSFKQPKDVRLRKYLASYYQIYRSDFLPAWSVQKRGSFFQVLEQLMIQVGRKQCQLLKIEVQSKDATTEHGFCKRKNRDGTGLSQDSTQVTNKSQLWARLQASESCLSFSVVALVTILYAVFTPFESEEVLEMRGKLLVLLQELNESLSHLKLRESENNAMEIANTSNFALGAVLYQQLNKTIRPSYLFELAVSEIFSWWCYQQNPERFWFLHGSKAIRNVQVGFLGLLKDLVFVNWVGHG